MAEASWLARFDHENSTADLDLPIVSMIYMARNRVDHRNGGAELLTAAEVKLQLLEKHAAARELHRLADAGDEDAVAACVRRLAELEIAADAAKERNRVEYARLCAKED